MILLSAHKDTVKHPFKLSAQNGWHTGLLDNFVGMLVSYLCVYGNDSLVRMFKDGEIGFFHSEHEEFGLDDLPKVQGGDTVIVIDVACGDRYTGKDFVIDTWTGFDAKHTLDILENMAWEGFNFEPKPLEEASDESDTWAKHSEKDSLRYPENDPIRVVSFIVPIAAPDDNWHGEKAAITADAIAKSARALQRLICYLDTWKNPKT